MPVLRGEVVLPSADTNTPDVPIDASALHIAEVLIDELKIPHRVKFTPSQLAQDVGGSTRAWQMECAAGNIGAVHFPGGWVIPWSRFVRYVAEHQKLVTRD